MLGFPQGFGLSFTSPTSVFFEPVSLRLFAGRIPAKGVNKIGGVLGGRAVLHSQNRIRSKKYHFLALLFSFIFLNSGSIWAPFSFNPRKVCFCYSKSMVSAKSPLHEQVRFWITFKMIVAPFLDHFCFIFRSLFGIEFRSHFFDFLMKNLVLRHPTLVGAGDLFAILFATFPGGHFFMQLGSISGTASPKFGRHFAPFGSHLAHFCCI